VPIINLGETFEDQLHGDKGANIQAPAAEVLAAHVDNFAEDSPFRCTMAMLAQNVGRAAKTRVEANLAETRRVSVHLLRAIGVMQRTHHLEVTEGLRRFLRGMERIGAVSVRVREMHRLFPRFPFAPLSHEARDFIEAYEAYEVGDPKPMYSLVRRWSGKRLGMYEKRVLRGELRYIWNHWGPRRTFVLFTNPKRWLDRGADIERVQDVRQKFKSGYGDIRKALIAVTNYYGMDGKDRRVRERFLMELLKDTVGHRSARLLSDEELITYISRYIRQKETEVKRKPEANRVPDWDVNRQEDKESFEEQFFEDREHLAELQRIDQFLKRISPERELAPLAVECLHSLSPNIIKNLEWAERWKRTRPSPAELEAFLVSERLGGIRASVELDRSKDVIYQQRRRFKSKMEMVREERRTAGG
jgi:hypothetical protein